MRSFLILLAASVVSISGVAQTLLDVAIPTVQQQVPLKKVLERIEEDYPLRFFYLEEWLEPFQVDPQSNGLTIRELLTDLLKNSDIIFNEAFGYAVILIKDPKPYIERTNLLETAAAEKKSIQKVIIGTAQQSSLSGKAVTLTGRITDGSHTSPLAGVLISLNDTKATSSDTNGQYSLDLPVGAHVVLFQSPGYADQLLDLEIYSSGSVSIALEEPPTLLEEVTVSDEALVTKGIGQSEVHISDIKRAPTFLGEVDLIKQVQNQPGVTTVGEIANGFNVRGGGVDQNLVLYDGVPIFNTAHALGLITAFSADAINRVSFYRGGIPAEFGGRVSSVLDITSKEGSSEKWGGSGGVGIISSYLTVGGPIKKSKTSAIASGRISYSDWMLDAIKSNYKNVKNSSVFFYDASAKITHTFSDKDKLTLSGYTSFDKFSLVNDTLYNSENVGISLELDHIFSEKLFSTLSLSFGKYSYKMIEEDPWNAFELNYDILYPSIKFDLHIDGKHDFTFGIHNTFYDFNPGELRPTTNESNAREIRIDHERSLESAFYVSDAFTWHEKFFLEAGLRTSVFNRVGPGTVYQYQDNRPIETRYLVDSTQYKKGDVIKTYVGLEPRLSIRYTVDPISSIKLGYNRIYQYMHLVTNTAAVTPVDIWQSSNTYFRPQIADQISLGYYRYLKDNVFETFVEVFYKTTQNILDFKDGSNLILNKNLETALLPGQAKAYGAEFSISKVKGRLTGNINYTYSRSWRKVDGKFSQEKINDGDYYPSNYDQPHVAVMNWRYGFSRRHFFSGTFTYHTGRPMSLPLSGYQVDGIPVANFSNRNLYRVPDYHRLDIAFIIEGNHKRKKALDGTWVFSFYNVYGRKNAYSVFYKDDGKGYLKPYQLSVIGSIIPSISYNFKF